MALGAAGALCLAVLTACGISTLTTAKTATDGGRSQPAPTSSPLTPQGGPEQAEMARKIKANEPIDVLDHTGRVRGTLRQSDIDDQNDRIDARLGYPPKDKHTPPLPPPSAEKLSALQVLEAFPVYDNTGQLTGYVGGHFMDPAQYQDERAKAEALVASAP